MLTEEQLAEVKQEYIDIIKSLKRKDCDIDGFLAYLEDTDFFTAPASTQYHCSFSGGLCLHSINVYKIMLGMTNRLARKVVDNPKYNPDDKESTEKPQIKVPLYSRDSIILVALLHDLNKVNFYEKTSKNEKDYCDDGKYSDAMGNFNWKTTVGYKVIDAENRSLGNKGITSYLRASMFFALTEEEMNALIYQYSATDKETVADLSSILARYNLSVFLHSADIIATYCIEK